MTMRDDYFTYLPENRTCALWGCTVRGLGHTRSASDSIYPPHRHPDDHHFLWESGRILDAWQIIFITSGRGTFESARTQGPQAVEAGSLFVLFPEVWHRYAPDPRSGWTEHWIECRGTAFDSALERDAIRPEEPIYPAGADFARIFNEIHAWAARDALAFQTVLSAQALQLLALLISDRARNGCSEESALVQRAMMHILEHASDPLNMRQIARDMNVGYTRFRDLFRAHARISPKQYHLHVRLERARDLLLNTSKPLKEIAAILGFHSAFHFSNQFRASNGVSPRAWRKQEAR